MSIEYTNEFGERIIILSDGPQDQVQHQHEETTNPGPGAIVQLIANTNFSVDDDRDYSTLSHNIPISLNKTIANGVKTYAINVLDFINNSDVTKFRYIKVEYTGQPSIRELREMFVDWFIYAYNIGTITYNNMSIFQDHMKIYSNSDGNGGSVVYNLYPEIISPNGFLRWMFAFSGRIIPMCFNFKEIPGVSIDSVTLTATHKFLPEALRRSEMITHGIGSPRWQYFSTNAITVSLPEPSRTTDHIIEATGNVHGIFIKSAATIMSVKITLNNQIYIDYTNAIDVQLNTIKFGDDGLLFMPFDLERKYERLSDCFVADHNGGLELGRIDTINVKIQHQNAIDNISYAFPAYMSLHRRFIRPELVCRNPRAEMMSGYDVYRLVFGMPLPVTGSLCDILSNAGQTPSEVTDVCIISHEPIESDAAFAVCMTCSKPMLLDYVISWLKTPIAHNTCPHCRCKWREIDTSIKVFKQVISS